MRDAASLRKRDDLETRQSECCVLQFAIGAPERNKNRVDSAIIAAVEARLAEASAAVSDRLADSIWR
jgi:hypothetical protein